MSLRLATMEDIDSVFNLCRLCHQEYPVETFEINEEKARREIRRFIQEDDKLVLVVEEEEIYGVLIAFAAPLFYSDSYQAYELLWWVRPEFRKKPGALKLFFAYEYWAKKLGCRSIQTSTVHGWTDLSSFYLRRGYERTEESFRKVIHGN